eukprot:TRINITY_DN20598_c0_g1_i2.p1 TRINITY_DN20598_c0_g1~~TRINITY_DN20598_c0_g1_i2.p1  ORF type:complete len:1359 (+),score=368.82 TRINITY_DN20598_c0_g1_i2:117-4193(+)
MPRQRQRNKADLTRQRLKSRLLRLPKRARLQEMASQLNSEDPMTRREIADVFKSVLGKGGGVQIDEIIELGVIPRFVEFLQCHDDPILQIEASMILNSIVTSDKAEHTEAVVEAGALPHLVQLLRSTNETANLQAAWVLNNIASESVVYRDRVVVEQGLSALLVSMQDIPFPEAGQLALKTQLSALLSFCGDRLGDRSKLPAEVISPALQVLRKILNSSDPKADDEVLCMVCSVISCISKDGEDDSIGQIVDAELCALLVELLRHRNPRVQAASVRALGNLVSGDDERHTQAVLDCAVLPQLLLVLENQNHLWETRSDICWMLSNIAVGSLEQIQQLIESNLIPTLVALLEEQSDHIDVRTEAAWVVSNSAASGSRTQIKYLVSQRCIHVLCHLLVLSEDSDLEMVNGVLHALENILEAGAAEAAQQMAMLRDEVETAMEKAEVFSGGTEQQAAGGPPVETAPLAAEFEHLSVKEGLNALTEQEEIAKMFPIATTLLNGKNKLKGAPAATSALEHVQNPYAVVLEQVGGVNFIAQFLALSEEYTVVESARRILENHYGMKTSASEVSLHLAAQEGNLEAASKLIRHGAEVDAKDNAGRTPLIIGASLGHLELVQLLVDAGSDINAADTNHQTPIKLSASGGFKDMARYLIGALKHREETKKVRTELEKKLKLENEKQKQADMIQCVVYCLQSSPGDWDQLQAALDQSKQANIPTESQVTLATRLLSCKIVLSTGLLERDRSRLQGGVEEAKRIESSIRMDGVSVEAWLGGLRDEAGVVLQWLQEEKDAVGELKSCINQRDAGKLKSAISTATALISTLAEQGEESALLLAEVASASKVQERLGKEEEAATQLQQALEATPVLWSELEAAIRNAERFGLRSEVERGRKVLKDLILSARQEVQAAIKSRNSNDLKDTISKVEKLGIESLNGELDVARKIADTVEKEARLIAKFESTFKSLSNDRSLDGPQSEWDSSVKVLERLLEDMKSLGMDCREPKARLSTLRPQHQLHKLLLSALDNPSELSNAIEKAKACKSLSSKSKPLLEAATSQLEAEVTVFVSRLELVNSQTENAGSVDSLLVDVKAAGLFKSFKSRPGVRDALLAAQEAQEQLVRTQKELQQQLTASAERALKERTSLAAREQTSPAPVVAACRASEEDAPSVSGAPVQVCEPVVDEIQPPKKSSPSKRVHKQHTHRSVPAAEGSAAEAVPVEVSSQGSGAGDGNENGRNGSALLCEEPITVGFHESMQPLPGGAVSRLDAVLANSRARPDQKVGSSYAQMAKGQQALKQAQKSRFVHTQAPSDNEGATTWQLPDSATPSSWVEACASARAEQDLLHKTDSASEDAFIQSIFRELDLDDED